MHRHTHTHTDALTHIDIHTETRTWGLQAASTGGSLDRPPFLGSLPHTDTAPEALHPQLPERRLVFRWGFLRPRADRSEECDWDTNYSDPSAHGSQHCGQHRKSDSQRSKQALGAGQPLSPRKPCGQHVSSHLGLKSWGKVRTVVVQGQEHGDTDPGGPERGREGRKCLLPR